MKAYRFTDPAMADLNDLQDFFDLQGYGLGDDVRAEVRAVVARIREFPYIYSRIDNSPSTAGYSGRNDSTFSECPPARAAVEAAPLIHTGASTCNATPFTISFTSSR